MLMEQTQVSDAALPVAEFREHLQLGRGFADDGLQDPVLLSLLRAALVAVEGETGKALLPRAYRYVVTAWWDPARQVLPVAPVSAIQSLTLEFLGGSTEVVAPETYRLIEETHAPVLAAVGLSLPVIPVGGHAEIVFDAGYGTDWAAAPADLRQAVFLLAAHFYENRSALVEKGRALPMGVAAICARYKPIRIFGGGRR